MKNRISILWISVLLQVSSCTGITGTPSPAITATTSLQSNSTSTTQVIKSITSEYTPIVMIPEGTALPSSATLVFIEDLVTHPILYVDMFIEVHGFNVGVTQKPACSPLFGPPTEWGLRAGPYIVYSGGEGGYEPPFIDIKNDFGHAIYQPIGKQLAVWGWWRLYEGPIGCGGTFSNPQGTPIPMQNQQAWYLDAVKLQFLESIEVPSPTKK